MTDIAMQVTPDPAGEQGCQPAVQTRNSRKTEWKEDAVFIGGVVVQQQKNKELFIEKILDWLKEMDYSQGPSRCAPMRCDVHRDRAQMHHCEWPYAQRE